MWQCFDLRLKLLQNMKCSHRVYTSNGEERCAQDDAHVKHCVNNDLQRDSRAKHKLHATCAGKKQNQITSVFLPSWPPSLLTILHSNRNTNTNSASNIVQTCQCMTEAV